MSLKEIIMASGQNGKIENCFMLSQITGPSRTQNCLHWLPAAVQGFGWGWDARDWTNDFLQAKHMLYNWATTLPLLFLPAIRSRTWSSICCLKVTERWLHLLPFCHKKVVIDNTSDPSTDSSDGVTTDDHYRKSIKVELGGTKCNIIAGLTLIFFFWHFPLIYYCIMTLYILCSSSEWFAQISSIKLPT